VEFSLVVEFFRVVAMKLRKTKVLGSPEWPAGARVARKQAGRFHGEP
jgi:hypothetical protein